MDLTVDLGVIVQSAILAAIVWHGKTVRELVTAVKLHDWRISQLEESPGGKCCKAG